MGRERELLMASPVTTETQNLDRLIRSLAKTPVIRVGILGDKDSRSGAADSNATVGAAHEFGTSRMPRRSFLLEPLKDQFSKYLEKYNAFDDDTLKEVVKSGSLTIWMKKLAAIAETVVLDAFHNNGFGKWKPWSPGYSNKSGQLLVDTQQLVRSITSEVSGE